MGALSACYRGAAGKCRGGKRQMERRAGLTRCKNRHLGASRAGGAAQQETALTSLRKQHSKAVRSPECSIGKPWRPSGQPFTTQVGWRTLPVRVRRGWHPAFGLLCIAHCPRSRPSPTSQDHGWGSRGGRAPPLPGTRSGRLPVNTNLQVSRDHPAVREEVVGHLTHGVLYAQGLAVLPGFQTGERELGLGPAEDGQHPAGDGFRGFLHRLRPDLHRIQTWPERSALGNQCT
ncbi:hypothetical protein D623_10014568 [Myotis brandtii]|uniref:Uncharacterized protein n=1 Tax=Myotis brandtii TaxID=109478 RepID=S7MIK6_MYOBR|nr:hypothetical protein D623_10014568 [Myotis brandtii]